MSEAENTNARGMRIDPKLLKRKLARATFRNKLRALALVAPLLIFIIVTFILPIGQMLLRSVDNKIVPDTLPRTVVALAEWNPKQEPLPSEAAYLAIIQDLREAKEQKTHTKVGQRLNYETPGISSLFRKTPRKIAPRSQRKLDQINADIAEKGAKAVLIAVDSDWGERKIWTTIKNFSGNYTIGYFIAAVDHEINENGDIQAKSENERIYINLFTRTLFMSLFVTVMTLLLGFPIAYLLATLPSKTSNLLLILVLLPFWTSLLVRTSAWIVLLQQEGVVNNLLTIGGLNWPIYTVLSWFGDPDVTSLCQDNLGLIVSQGANALEQFTARIEEVTIADCTRNVLATYQDQGAKAALEQALALQQEGEAIGYGDERFTMIFNQTGAIVAMTHILLPFMILPLYSVMKTIPPSYVRAAKSLGASNTTAFIRVYFPNTIPGIGAGAVLVFILSIGYYITPELVGGTTGTFISNRIAYHISSSLNWGLAAALGSLLLFVVMILYYVYDRIVGIDNVKLG